VFENRVLRRMIGPERDQLTRGEAGENIMRELHSSYSSPNIIRMIMRWAGHAACIREMINTYKILVGKPEGKRSLGRTRRVWMILKWILEE
jgi:hypothetical protein